MLSVENHQWFNKQSAESQKKMNSAFQEYKRIMNVAMLTSEGVTAATSIEFDMSDFIEIPLENNDKKIKEKYNRAKVKREWQKEMEMDDY